MGMYIIAEPCIGTKDTACVEVCPVDCIHPRKDETSFETEEKLYIDPETCIDCGACVPVCPVSAIFALDDLPEKWKEYTALNADLATKWPNINKQKEPLPGAEENKEKEGKRGMLSMEGFSG